MLIRAVSLLNPPKLRLVRKQLPHFVLFDMVLHFYFLDKVVKPNESCDLHQPLPDEMALLIL
jgi:hypothetical protein